MLSRLGLRVGAQAWRVQAQLPVSMAAMPVCHYKNHTRTVDERLKAFKEVNETYYNGAQRDQKNWPTETMPTYTPPTRLLIIPDSWFANMYSRSGVSGPYMLVFGTVAFMFSKELLMWDEHLAQVYGYSGAMFYVWYKLHRKFNKMTELETQDEDNEWWYGPKERARQKYVEAGALAEKAIWQLEGQKHMFEAMKENVDLQLETIYRKRMAEAQSAVKKRLDYQLEKENTERRFQHEYMTSWIVNSVVKGITPQQESAAITQCIADLKAISAKQ